MSTRCEDKGFTLVEILVVTSLFFVIGAGLLTTFLTGQSSYLSTDAYIQVQQESRKAFDNVVRELRESGTISCGPTAIATCPAVLTPRLNFRTALSYDPIAGISWGSDGVVGQCTHFAIIGAGNNAQLIRWTDGAATTGPVLPCAGPTCRVLANNVNTATSGFLATDISNPADFTADVVTLQLEILYTNPALPGGSQRTGMLRSQVRLRNPQ